MSTIRPEFHSNVVSLLLDEVFYQRSSLYYFLGKIETWDTADEPPVAPSNSVYDDVLIRDNMVYMRKIAPTEVSLVTTRYVWQSGMVYDQWDHTIDLKGDPFFVVTDEFNVYKCLDNNNGANSTVKPTTNSLFPFRTSDGYLWKYMYNVPSFKRTKFLSRNYLPVQKALTDTFYNKGAVESVVVTNAGSGYTNVQQTTIAVTGTTTGANATAEIDTVGTLGEITGLNVILGGTGYTAGALVTVDSLTGSGAVIEIVASGGIVTGFNIVDGGVGYQTTDEVTISVGGAELIPVVSQSTGSIVEVRILNPGAGYTAAPTLTVNQSPATGTGLYGNDDAILTAVIYQGSIVVVTIEDPGQDYPVDTATTIVVAGDGSGAVFSPVIYNEQLVDVVVENPGTDYTYMTLNIVGTGEGATAVAVLATSDFVSDQSLVEQVAVKGAIYSVVVTEAGDNYSSESTVEIDGDGTGATAELTLNEEGGVTQIRMVTYGQNYTYANITINDPNRPTPNSFTDMQAYATLPPLNGHGYDAVKELYGDTLSIFTTLRDDTQLALLEQDYRQYGLITNPTNLFTNKRITTSTSFIVFTLTLASVGSLAADDVLVCNNKRYRVVSIDGTEVKVQQLNSIYSQPSGTFYDEANPSTIYTIQSVDVVPNANKYSGNLLYVTNNAPFTPTVENSIAIRTYIKL